MALVNSIVLYYNRTFCKECIQSAAAVTLALVSNAYTSEIKYIHVVHTCSTYM